MDRNRTNDAVKKGVSCGTVLVVLLIDLFIGILWIIGINNTDKNSNFYTILRDTPDLLRNLSTFSVAIFGVTIVRKGIFDKGGTKYYPTSCGKNKLGNIIGEYNEYPNYSEVVEVISELLVPYSEDPFDCRYFQYVYKLQKIDDDFVKVWNDYNFYSAKEMKKPEDRKYLKQLEKYIFIKIYNEHNITMKSDK